MSFNNKLKFTASSIALISAALHPSIASSVPLDENVSVISSNTYTADGRVKDMYDMRNGLDITGGTLEVKNEAAVIETSGNALNISGGNVSKSTVVTPYVGMRYLNVDQESYVDSDGKHIATDKSDLLTVTASTKVKTDFELDDNTTITPEARFGVTYDVVSDGANSIVSLSNGASYEVESRRLDRFGVELGAGVSAHVNDNWEITAGYEGKFKQDYQDHTGTFDIKYNF